MRHRGLLYVGDIETWEVVSNISAVEADLV